MPKEPQVEEPETDATAASLDELVERIYGELRQIAHRHRSQERKDLTLQTTALVHEAYLRLANADHGSELHNRRHLKALTSRIIRHVLVDYGRRTAAAKRDPDQAPPGRIEDTLIEPSLDVDVVDLDEALHRLSRHAPRLERVVECRFFGGLNVEETAEALDLSTRTVERDWRKARTWLLRYLAENDDEPGSTEEHA